MSALKVCWICLENINGIPIRCCSCTIGDHVYAHDQCLEIWSAQREQCQFCGHRYNVRRNLVCEGHLIHLFIYLFVQGCIGYCMVGISRR
jgi:hypothetical protein